jgi:hypothetical protein
MFERLLTFVRWTAWAATVVVVAYALLDTQGLHLPHEGALWVALIVVWALFIELKGREWMALRVITEVDKIVSRMDKRMDDYEMHTLGHTLAAEQALGCRPGTMEH